MNNNPGHVVSGIVDCLNWWHGNNCTVLQYIVYAYKPHTAVTQPHHRSLGCICAKISTWSTLLNNKSLDAANSPEVQQLISWLHDLGVKVVTGSKSISISHMVIYLASHISHASSFGPQQLWYHSQPCQHHRHQINLRVRSALMVF